MPLSDTQREALQTAITKAKPAAERYGPDHGMWPTIMDAEALLDGRPTRLQGTIQDQVRACLDDFKMGWA